MKVVPFAGSSAMVSRRCLPEVEPASVPARTMVRGSATRCCPASASPSCGRRVARPPVSPRWTWATRTPSRWMRRGPRRSSWRCARTERTASPSPSVRCLKARGTRSVVRSLKASTAVRRVPVSSAGSSATRARTLGREFAGHEPHRLDEVATSRRRDSVAQDRLERGQHQHRSRRSPTRPAPAARACRPARRDRPREPRATPARVCSAAG